MREVFCAQSVAKLVRTWKKFGLPPYSNPRIYLEKKWIFKQRASSMLATLAGRNSQKNGFLVFFGNFWAYVGQPHGHIGWTTLMPFATFNLINPRTNPVNFHKKILRISDFEKWSFLSRPFWFFFCFIPMNISHKLCIRIDRTQFLW